LGLRLSKQVLPTYPSDAKKKNITGKTIVELLVNSKGLVESAKVLKSTNRIFDEPSLIAAKQFEFEPPADPKRKYFWVVVFEFND